MGKSIINTDSIKIEEAPTNENYSDSNKYTKLDSGSASDISSLLHFLNSQAIGNTLSGAYRVEFPKGFTGVLTPHGDGYLAMLRDPETKSFLAHGTLYSLDDLGLMYNAFSVLSLATGQYFMSQINDNLRGIQTKLDDVLNFLYTDKSCEIYAETKMINSIYINAVSIMHCSEQRIAALQTIQRAKTLAERNIQFYYRDMKKLATKHDALDSLQNDLNNYTQAVSLYGVCAVMEIVLSENFDEDFMKYIESDLKRHVEKHHEEVGQLKGMLINMPKATGPAPFFQPQKVDTRKQQELLKLIDELLGTNSPVKGYTEVISQMRAEYNNKSEFRITSDGSVYKCS